MRRVVVTGIGLLTPLGQGTDITWKAILEGKSGAGRITTFDPTDYACQIAGVHAVDIGLHSRAFIGVAAMGHGVSFRFNFNSCSDRFGGLNGQKHA